jgi:hypothetical protein
MSSKDRENADQLTNTELEKIDNISLTQVKAYLEADDPASLIPILQNTNNKNASSSLNINNKINSKKPPLNFRSTKKKTLVVKRLKRPTQPIKNEPKNKTKIDDQEVVEEVEPNTSKKSESKKSLPSLGLNEYIILGKRIHLTKSDFQKYIRSGKWCCGEFFRLKTIEESNTCVLCSYKCKTTIDGVFVCAHCRNFGYKALVKHHMFVCKNPARKSSAEQDMCQFRRMRDLTMHSDQIYCRYCHFYKIINKIPNLKRLQKHLVQFVHNRVLFVNSVSKKTEMWKSRLDLNNDFKSNKSISNKSSPNKKNTSEKQAKQDKTESIKIETSEIVKVIKVEKEVVEEEAKQQVPIQRHSSRNTLSEYSRNFKSSSSSIKKDYSEICSNTTSSTCATSSSTSNTNSSSNKKSNINISSSNSSVRIEPEQKALKELNVLKTKDNNKSSEPPSQNDEQEIESNQENLLKTVIFLQDILRHSIFLGR